jgi:NADH-quinone oxidoreductase subunit L
VETINSILPLLILVSPLVGFIINGVVIPWSLKGYAKTSANTAGGIATTFIGLSFILAAFAFSKLSGSASENPVIVSYCFEWFNFGGLSIPFELKIDKLSFALLCLILRPYEVGAFIYQVINILNFLSLGNEYLSCITDI